MKKILISIFSLVLILSTFSGVTPSVFAAENENAELTQNTNQDSSVENIKDASQSIDGPLIETPEDSTEMGTFGIKRWIAQEAMEAVADALRFGGSIVDDVIADLGKGKKTARTFAKHTDDIADVLDELAKESEVLEQRIIDQIAGALYDLDVPLSTARQIANAFTFLAF